MTNLLMLINIGFSRINNILLAYLEGGIRANQKKITGNSKLDLFKQNLAHVQ